ncbi:MAG: hypothetical protein DRP42_01280 [Tenericutes bacterium]|nr:MAG: hypothetical protein DRP42_01280 [Mycoplasmatota bacterium]
MNIESFQNPSCIIRENIEPSVNAKIAKEVQNIALFKPTFLFNQIMNAVINIISILSYIIVKK